MSALEQRRLLVGIGVSLLLHALVLSLRFGVPAVGGATGSAPAPMPVSVRLAEAETPPPALPEPLPEPARAPVSGMRLVPPRAPAPPVAAPAQPAPLPETVKPRKARRVSSPTARARLDDPPRVIAQNLEPNDFLVEVPQPEESEQKTLDPLETQHGGDEGKDNAEALAQAEREQEQQRQEEAARRETERLAEQARQEQQAADLAAQQETERRERELAEQQRLARERADRERAEQDRASQERLAQQRLEQERAAQERQVQERLVQERLQRERAEQERLAQERAAQERAAQERAAQERAAQERLAQERQARERAAQDRLAQQRAAAPAGDPFDIGPGAGGRGATAGAGAGGAGQRAGNDPLGTDLGNRARELVRGLDILKGAPPPAAGGKRRVVVGAAERDIPLRHYVDSWRLKIERSGGVHYPKSWASNGGADPLVSVALRSDGTVEEVTIVRSSGRPDMDDKVRQIVRLNARYAQFPPNIAARYDVIDIRRIWRFDDALKLVEELP